eukprot:CAMPEP_0185857800 /NCGR_PEP_ID=MMETSP1354-20130828/29689_1 /TAXON_ID=708628 /ORGANISM="Erythrolobus madagascarensis, Strain CCMP3276" /LENGTH=43 /DNA_ID= /DNA_START= /DNA_END= /DNA_ORIENTATION=
MDRVNSVRFSPDHRVNGLAVADEQQAEHGPRECVLRAENNDDW